MRFVISTIVLVAATITSAQDAKPFTEASVQAFLNRGDLPGAEKAMTAALQTNVADDQARASLGVVQVLTAVQNAGRSLYAYGLKSHRGELDSIPLLRLPVADNPNPKLLTYAGARKIVEDFVAELARAESTLAAIKDPAVKLPLKVGLVRLDFVGNGAPGGETSLAAILSGAQRGRVAEPGDDIEMRVVLDAGDIQWLRGYCHLTIAMLDFALGYDEHELFNATAHVFFKNVDSPNKFLHGDKGVFRMSDVDIADVIAMIHLIRFPVADAKKLSEARDHFKQVAACSRQSWKAILAETDDDYEWIPNPNQKSVLPNMTVTTEMISGWTKFMDEFDQLLDGKVLIPFWRGNSREPLGVNLSKVFTKPEPFDLILWIQGSAAAPFLEKGTMTEPDIYRNLERVFEGDIFTFAVWFN